MKTCRFIILFLIPFVIAPVYALAQFSKKSKLTWSMKETQPINNVSLFNSKRNSPIEINSMLFQPWGKVNYTEKEFSMLTNNRNQIPTNFNYYRYFEKKNDYSWIISLGQLLIIDHRNKKNLREEGTLVLYNHK
jgi:hypothetical protein